MRPRRITLDARLLNMRGVRPVTMWSQSLSHSCASIVSVVGVESLTSGRRGLEQPSHVHHVVRVDLDVASAEVVGRAHREVPTKSRASGAAAAGNRFGPAMSSWSFSIEK